MEVGEVLERQESRRRTALLVRRGSRLDAVTSWHEPPPGPLAVERPVGLVGDAVRLPDEVEGLRTVHRDVPAAGLARVLAGLLGRPVELAAVAGRLGGVLRAAHDADPGDAPPARARLVRLRDVVGGVEGTGAELLAERWRAAAGEAHWELLGDGLAAALQRPARAWGLGDPAVANVRCGADGDVVVLADGHAGPVDPAVEVGMLLGELLEMAEVLAAKDERARDPLLGAAAALLAGYGALHPDDAQVAVVVAAARPLLHAADFQRYVAAPGEGVADEARVSRYGVHSVRVGDHAAALLHRSG